MAEATEQNRSGDGERQLVTFHLGREEFGADIMNVREIVRLGEVTQVPQAPAYVEGVTNLRGTILPIMGGRKRFGLESRVNDESTRVLVVDVRGSVTGVIVDRVAEVLRVSGEDIEPSPTVLRSSIDAALIDGIVKMDQGRRIIMTLNIGAVLAVDQAACEATDAAVAAATLEKDGAAEKMDEDQLVTFSLAGAEYAVDIMRVKEIIRVPGITKVPNAMHYFEGVVSIRNQLLPIVNMRTFFGLPDMAINDQARVIIVDTGAVTAGFRVDRVAEVIRVPRTLIEPPPIVFSSKEGDRVRGVAKLDGGKRLLMCLNAENLLTADAFAGLANEAGENVGAAIANNDKESSAIDEEQLVTFLLGKGEFAVQINQVQEINRMTEVTHMPGAPHYVDGLVNLRGNIIPAFNLRRRFGLDDRERDDATRIIIVDLESRKTGIIVDAVSEVLRFDRSLVEATPEMIAGGIDGEYISGVGKLMEGKRMVLILDLAKVVRIDAAPREVKGQKATKRKK